MSSRLIAHGESEMLAGSGITELPCRWQPRTGHICPHTLLLSIHHHLACRYFPLWAARQVERPWAPAQRSWRQRSPGLVVLLAAALTPRLLGLAAATAQPPLGTPRCTPPTPPLPTVAHTPARPSVRTGGSVTTAAVKSTAGAAAGSSVRVTGPGTTGWSVGAGPGAAAASVPRVTTGSHVAGQYAEARRQAEMLARARNQYFQQVRGRQRWSWVEPGVGP